MEPAINHNPVPQIVTFLIKDMMGGGVQTNWVRIASAFADSGYRVELLVCNVNGPLLDSVPPEVKVVELESSPLTVARCYALRAALREFSVLLRPVLVNREPSKTLRYLPGLAAYLEQHQPAALYAATPYQNIEAWLARRLAHVSTRLIVSEHNNLSHGHPWGCGLHGRYLPQLLRRIYMEAEGVIAVSNGVAEDIAVRTGLPRDRITTIYNPAVPDDLQSCAGKAIDHPWYQDGAPPVILAVGRLGRAKDYPTLLRAFARVRRDRPVRLMILGKAGNENRTAKRSAELKKLAAELGVADDFALPGYVANPYPYMAHAGVLVLSSRHEGFGNVVAEALACGCPVVSTDCHSGPSEILDNGRFGTLVRVGDDRALADAVVSALESTPDRERLQARGALYSVQQAADHYESFLKT